ncbi:MAG: exo-alpha-sialidase [Acidobacteriota bacterium]
MTLRIALAAALGLAASALAAEGPRIVVGPNILVSRDGDVAHCETMIAANPRDPANLLGGSITLTRPDGSSANKPYVSFDGGSTWKDVVLPEEFENGGGDPQVGFGISGTAYFMGLSPEMKFYRSEDGGRTWGKAVVLGKGHDHEMLVTDLTTGPYAGRVYVTDETDVPGSREMEDMQMRRRVVLFRSTDDGRSFVGPVEVARGHNTGLAAYNLLVLSDGTLFIPMSEYPNYAIDKTSSSWKAVFSTSTDGGVTFSAPRKIGDVPFGGLETMRRMQKSGRVDQISGAIYAVDASSGRFRDRIYAAWMALESDRFRLMLTYSSDRGRTWAKPKPVEAAPPAHASQFQPMIAVNSDGVLGVFFYDTDEHPKRDRFDVSFTASVDGGETFLPKKRLSSESSSPFGPGNVRPGPIVQTDRGMFTTYFISGVSRWPDGGDYIGMTADTRGVFHPFWADARSGTYQLFTAAVRVPLEAAPAAAATADRTEAALTDLVTLLFDPVRFDAQTREVLVPVRIKNISKETLYPPFHLEVKELVHPYRVKSKDETSVPEILNSSNGKTGLGAVFDYSKTLGDLDALPPDAVTNALVWRLKASSNVKTDFYIGSVVTGSIEKKKESK